MRQYGSGKRHSKNVLNVQAQAAHATGILPGETVLENSNELIYYLPETSPTTLCMGVQMNRQMKLVFGQPIAYTMSLRLVTVTINAAGKWYPAIVDSRTGLTVLRHTLKRHIRNNYWRANYRNLFPTDFVGEGEALGAVTPVELKSKPKLERGPVVITAPCTGFILAFEAQPYTPLELRANVMFLGEPVIKHVVFQGERVGHFNYVPGQESPIGKIIEAGTLLATVTSLRIPQDVIMPENGLIVRQYVSADMPVEFGQQIYMYIPLEKPLTS